MVDTALYDLLQVSPGATPTEIKRSFHKLALANHPDKGGHAEDFAAINNAYEYALPALSACPSDILAES